MLNFIKSLIPSYSSSQASNTPLTQEEAPFILETDKKAQEVALKHLPTSNLGYFQILPREIIYKITDDLDVFSRKEMAVVSKGVAPFLISDRQLAINLLKGKPVPKGSKLRNLSRFAKFTYWECEREAETNRWVVFCELYAGKRILSKELADFLAQTSKMYSPYRQVELQKIDSLFFNRLSSEQKKLFFNHEEYCSLFEKQEFYNGSFLLYEKIIFKIVDPDKPLIRYSKSYRRTFPTIPSNFNQWRWDYNTLKVNYSHLTCEYCLWSYTPSAIFHKFGLVQQAGNALPSLNLVPLEISDIKDPAILDYIKTSVYVWKLKLKDFPNEFQNNFDIQFAILEQDPYEYENLPSKIKQSKEFLIEALYRGVAEIKYDSPIKITDKGILLAALTYNPSIFYKASKELQADEDVRRAAGLVWV
ncbi:MAG: hypothetical protein K0S74_378 [Chlamydiales bacterium]|jgi:hypothetical protein|nr:hypothetical protein [Chlamydiales bacterium]